MRPIKKKPQTAKELERSIKNLILDQEQYECIKPDGSLDEHFILSYLIRNNNHAAKGYHKILLAYEQIKKHEAFIKVMEARKVTKKTLQSMVLFYESLVRPIKKNEETIRGSILIGEILKLSTPQFDEGEEWKASLNKKEHYKVGDKVFYYMKSNIILDNELLHLVSSFTGKLLE